MGRVISKGAFLKGKLLKMSGLLSLVLAFGFGLAIVSCRERASSIVFFNDSGSAITARFFIRSDDGVVTYSTHSIQAGQTAIKTGVRGEFRIEIDAFLWTYGFPAGAQRPFGCLGENVSLRFTGSSLVPME